MLGKIKLELVAGQENCERNQEQGKQNNIKNDPFDYYMNRCFLDAYSVIFHFACDNPDNLN
jgi:hypothetical protein